MREIDLTIHDAIWRLATICSFLGWLSYSDGASAAETTAREALIVDFDTGAILFEKNADVPMPPASMSKIMTVYIAFERLKKGHLSLDDEIPISEKAWRKGGSKMFIDVNSRVKVQDLLRGIIVQSGNDAAIAIAEALSGSEEEFADEMTQKAKDLGLKNSRFRNATGWPDPQHRMTARDLATLAIATIRNFPDYYKIYSEKTFTFNKIRQGNRNPLLYKSMGADGLKTGHTNAAGYGLTASVERSGRRLILVLNGLQSVRARTRESEALIEWGFREFANYKLLKADKPVELAAVWLGEKRRVPLFLERDLLLTLKRSDRRKLRVMAVFNEPIAAPIKKGQRIATLRVTAPGMDPVERPLVAGMDVERLGAFGRIVAAASYLLWGPGD